MVQSLWSVAGKKAAGDFISNSTIGGKIMWYKSHNNTLVTLTSTDGDVIRFTTRKYNDMRNEVKIANDCRSGKIADDFKSGNIADDGSSGKDEIINKNTKNNKIILTLIDIRIS